MRLPAGLREQIEAAGLPLDRYGLFAAPLAGGAPLLSWQAGVPFALASTAKLVTSALALDLLGDAFRWQTAAHLTGPVHQGRLLGDLVIVGGGDATLTSEAVREWMQRLRSAGLQDVLGDIVLDRSAFRLAEEDHLGTPQPAPDRPHHLRPDALALDGGALHVALQEAGRGPPQLELTPPLAGSIRLVNAVARAPGCSASAQWRERPGSEELVVRGGWSPDCPDRDLRVAVLTPAELSRRAFGELWRQSGGRLQGRVREASAGPVPPWRLPDAQGRLPQPWSVQSSAALPELLLEMNKPSNNLIARHLMLSLAPQFPLQPATAAAAQARARSWLQAQGWAPAALSIDSGSGLSRTERGTPQVMVELLRRVMRGPQGHRLVASLPLAGVDGTLEHRLRGGAAQGRAWLKTGTLLDARALAGVVQARSGRWLAVALFANDAEAVAQATPALDACVEWLARHG